MAGYRPGGSSFSVAVYLVTQSASDPDAVVGC